ncbi:TPR-like protein [Peniophora sp. CONT]|nr:TPR-like protein [Peniophora sp. CONT]
MILSHICVFLCDRFTRIGELSDLNEAIAEGERAVELASDDDPDLFKYLNNLGRALQTRYDSSWKLDDLMSAIGAHTRALEVVPDSDPNKPELYANLGTAFYDRSQRTRTRGDLDSAISSYQRAVELTPDDQLNKVAHLSDLARALQNRFERLGDLDDLESSIKQIRYAIQVAPDDYIQKPQLLDRLGMTLHLRFSRLDDLEDLENAMIAHRRAFELLPEGHMHKSGPLSNLGLAIQTRYSRSGELSDLEQVISVLREAVSIPPDNHRFKPLQLTNLGNALRARFERLGDLEDLENAISAHRRAGKLMPNDPASLNSLGAALEDRFKRLHAPEDLEAAISAKRQAVAGTSDGHPALRIRLMNLGGALGVRFQEFGESKDIESSIELLRRAVELTPPNDPGKPDVLTNLGNALQLRFDHLHELEDLSDAIATHRHAIEITPEGRENRPQLLANLASALRSRFEHEHTQANFDAAVAGFMDATDQKQGSPLMRFQYAVRCILMFVEYPDFSSPELLVEVYSRILSTLPEVVWIGNTVHRRYQESARVGSMVNDAVAAAIDAGDPQKAVEWLEEGRALVWSQILSLRTPLDELKGRHPDLANEYREVIQQMQDLGLVAHILGPSDAAGKETSSLLPATNEAADRHRRAGTRYEQVLAEVRRCTGFEDFLLPKKFESLVASTSFPSGPVVFLNVASTRCDALVISSNGAVTLIPLPELTLQRARKLRSIWKERLEASGLRQRAAAQMPLRRDQRGDTESGFSVVLGRLWTWVVFPVLQALDLMRDSSNSSAMPHITWCPTGPLAQLPLHAAGIYDASQHSGIHVFDYVVSSYTPSLATLLRRHESIGSQRTTPDLLIITQPATPGQSPLPSTRDEGDRLQSIFPQESRTSLDHDQATVDATLAAASQHSWVHFACHGYQHPEDPTQSAFALFDGQLSLAALMRTTADNAELALLSACQTAAGDEKMPEESVHLAAGMLAVGFKGVVATMWSIKDEDAPVLVETYYKRLLELRKGSSLSESETGAAYALHDAVKTLREKVHQGNAPPVNLTQRRSISGDEHKRP